MSTTTVAVAGSAKPSTGCVLTAHGGSPLVRAQTRRTFAEPEFRLSHPAWSSDGRRLAFVGVRDEPTLQGPVSGIYVTSAMSQPSPRLARVPGDFPHLFKVSWGPGRLIAFDRLVHPGGLGLVNPDTGSSRELLRLGYEPDWSPHRTSLTFSYQLGSPSRGAIYVVRGDGRDARRVVAAPAKDLDYGDQKRMPAWSPDGRRLTYVWSYGKFDYLYVISARGGRKRKLATNIDLLGGLSWQARPPLR